MKILLYTFNARFNLTFMLLRRVSNKNIDKFYLSNLNSVYSLCRKITLKNYDFILGLGDFRRDAKKVRIEIGFINKYGTKKINENGKDFYTATWNLPAFNECYYSDKTSNGPCNQSGYLLSETIEKNGLKTKLAFAHIPKYFGVIEAEKLIRKWLEVIDPETSSG